MATAEEIRSLMTQMDERFVPEKAQGVNSTIQLNLTGDNGGQWWLRIVNNTVTLNEGTAETPDMTLTAKAEDLYNVFTGKTNAMSAFMQGKIKVGGDMSLAVKMQNMFRFG